MKAAHEVIVVGAGVAGLAAATRLAEAGAKPLVLEASPIAGGRARSWIDPVMGDPVDNGQHLLMGCYRETLAFLERIGMRRSVTFQDRLRVAFAAKGWRGAIDCPPLPGRLSVLAGLALYEGLGVAETLVVLQALRDAPSSPTKAGAGMPDESAAAWLGRLRQSAEARRAFWDPFIFAALNEDPTVASARTLRSVLAQALLQDPEDARLGWASVGLGDLYAPAAQAHLASRGGELRVSSPVLRVDAGQGSAEVVMRSGDAFTAGTVILAVPPAALTRLLPGLAGSPLLTAAAALRPSPILGVNLWLDREIVEEPFVGLLGTRLHWLFDKARMLSIAGSGAPRAASYLTLVASGARDLIELDAERLIRIALEDLREVFPRAAGARLVHASVVKEREATTSPAVGWDALRPGTRTEVPSLLLAGDWIATGLPATIESAALSGHRAADAVLSAP